MKQSKMWNLTRKNIESIGLPRSLKTSRNDEQSLDSLNIKAESRFSQRQKYLVKPILAF